MHFQGSYRTWHSQSIFSCARVVSLSFHDIGHRWSQWGTINPKSGVALAFISGLVVYFLEGKWLKCMPTVYKTHVSCSSITLTKQVAARVTIVAYESLNKLRTEDEKHTEAWTELHIWGRIQRRSSLQTGPVLLWRLILKFELYL